MSKIDDFRAKHPGVYDDLSDAEIADGIYQKSYSDMDRAEFDAAMGLGPSLQEQHSLMPQGMDDMQRVFMDALTRGGGDKLTGAGADTRRSRDRLPGYAEAAADIGGSIAGSPYRVASTGIGALAGGLEGAANAYGHQENWIPNWEDAKNIGWEGAKGAGLGVVGKKIGDTLGGLWSRFQAKKNQPFKTDDAFEDAAQKSLLEDASSPKTKEFLARSDRLSAAREAQDEGSRGAFAKMAEGMTNPAEAKIASDIGSGASSWPGKAADTLQDARKNLGPATIVSEAIATGGVPVKSIAAYTASKFGENALRKSAAKSASPREKEVEKLAALIRDPKGRGLAADPTEVAAIRDKIAKAMMGAGRSPTFGGPR